MRSHFVTVLSLVIGSSLSAQTTAPRYRPSFENPRGQELVAVLVSSSHCVGNSVPGFLTAVDSMNRALATQASRSGMNFVSIGVATDWEPDSGYAYLKSLSHFGELIVGRNWFNLGAAHYVWADSTGKPLEPQVILLERRTDMDSTGVRIGSDRVLARYLGAGEIVSWVKQGAPRP